jgi:hypothetical protein
MGRPFFVEKMLLSGWEDSGCSADGFCREFEATFLAGGISRDFRFLFGGREGSDTARLQGVGVLAGLLSTPSKGGSETEDAGCSSTG